MEGRGLITPWKRSTDFVSRTHLKDPDRRECTAKGGIARRKAQGVAKATFKLSNEARVPFAVHPKGGALLPMGIFEMGSSIKCKVIQSFWFTLFSGRKGEALVEVPKSLKTKSWFSVQSFLG